VALTTLCDISRPTERGCDLPMRVASSDPMSLAARRRVHRSSCGAAPLGKYRPEPDKCRRATCLLGPAREGGRISRGNQGLDSMSDWRRPCVMKEHPSLDESESVMFPYRRLRAAGCLALCASLMFLSAPAVNAQSLTIWPASATPQNMDTDTSAVELGVRFRSDVDGTITGIRFYKYASNTGTHIGNLWTNGGTRLATATFINETTSGWQQVTFASPVAISAGTTYVASYHTNVGRYATSDQYFATAGFDRAPLHALKDGDGGVNGVYRYGSASAFPDQTYRSVNYWVDVVFISTPGPDVTPPSITSALPANNATGIATGTNVTATFSEALDPLTVDRTTFALRDSAGTLVWGTLLYDTSNFIVTYIPAVRLADAASYSVTVTTGVTDVAGNAMAGPVVWSFTTAAASTPPPPTICPCSIWDPLTAPPASDDGDSSAVELGVRFRTDTAGYISGLRFYKFAGNTGVHFGSLWTTTGTLLGRATFANETATGWQQVTFSPPLAVAANTTYVASYHTDTGHYAATRGFFAAGVDHAPLHALRDGADGPNGVYRYGAMGFPDQTYQSANYWVDPVFTTSLPSPTVFSVTPSAGATNILTHQAITATFLSDIALNTINSTTFELRGPSGALVPGPVAAFQGESGLVNASLTPSSVLAYLTSYTASLKGGTNGIKDKAGTPMNADYTWSFTTGAPPPPPTACPCSIFSSAVAPAADVDTNAVELGVKFQSDTAGGYITALRFYKNPGNTGTHVGHLWTRTGALLATVTFINETAVGWQHAALSPPVPIAANTTYIASYHTGVGRYAASGSFFTSAVTNPPLRALANGADGGNGVYRYGPSGSFPDQSYQSANYWVDVVYVMNLPDTTRPTVMSYSPFGQFVRISANPAVNFSESMDPATINATTFELRGAGGALVPATVSYDAPSRTATLNPTDALEYRLTYTAVVKGGATGTRVMDPAGNALAASFAYSFTTAPAPTTNEGPGGPILVVAAAANPYSRYYAEILRAEGLNEFAVRDVSQISAFELAEYDVVVLGETPLTAAQVTMFSTWVNAGGHLIAMRPDMKLAGLLGLVDQASTLSNGYLAVDGSKAPGAGIVSQTMQFHGTADGYALGGATSVATLYSTASSPTPYPAVTLNAAGVAGGSAAAFAYDLARSIIYTRQGNPAWSGQERDGTAPITTDDLFFGASATDPQVNWIDLDKVAIPQADEQQRLLANLVLHMNRGRRPLPRFWYFPRGVKAVVIMTGDEDGGGGAGGRFDVYNAASPAGCKAENWECVRATAYVSPSTPLAQVSSVAVGYNSSGFEIAPQVDTGCANWTPASLGTFYGSQLSAFAAAFPSFGPPVTHRIRCSVWSDYATQPWTEWARGIALDTSYSFRSSTGTMDRPGFFTGSGMPMRFADGSGAMVDVYQAATHMTDQSGETFPFTVDTLLDRALGPEGYYGAFTANIHMAIAYSPESDRIVAAAKARGVPIIAARQLRAWLEGRNGASFQELTWNGTSLTFAVSRQNGTDFIGLQAMLPASVSAGTLATLTLNGTPVAFVRETIKGVEYGVFTVGPGTYRATYAP
jgi:hypothetical protein